MLFLLYCAFICSFIHSDYESENDPIVAAIYNQPYEALYQNWKTHVQELKIDWNIQAKVMADQHSKSGVWREKVNFWDELVDERKSFLFLDVDALPLKAGFETWFGDESLDIVAQRGAFPFHVNKEWSSSDRLEEKNTLCAGFIFMRPTKSVKHILTRNDVQYQNK